MWLWQWLSLSLIGQQQERVTERDCEVICVWRWQVTLDFSLSWCKHCSATIKTSAFYHHSSCPKPKHSILPATRRKINSVLTETRIVKKALHISALAISLSVRRHSPSSSGPMFSLVLLFLFTDQKKYFILSPTDLTSVNSNLALVTQIFSLQMRTVSLYSFHVTWPSFQQL